MSQEKIDKRKKSKGDLLHSTKKQMRNLTIIVAVILVAAGAFASVVSYKKGWEKGDAYGESVMFNYYQAFYGNQDDETTAAEGEETTAAKGDEETTAAEETVAEEETTVAEETVAEEETTVAE